MDNLTHLDRQNECYLVAPGGFVVPMCPETGVIVPPSSDPTVVRAWIMDLTNSMIAQLGEGLDAPVNHSYVDGMYVRELFIPKGTFLIGKVHKLACVNIVSKGDISVLTEHGSARIRAGFTGVSFPGIQKVGYAHEDTVFVNVFRVDEMNIEKIEQAIAFDSYEEAGYATPQGELIWQ